MSDIAVGDRVKVEFEGDVVYVGDSWRVDVRRTDGHGRSVVRFADCTVIAPPIKVGDTIDPDQAKTLPAWTVVRTAGATIAEKWDGGEDVWLTTGSEDECTAGDLVKPFTVIYLPGQS